VNESPVYSRIAGEFSIYDRSVCWGCIVAVFALCFNLHQPCLYNMKCT